MHVHVHVHADFRRAGEIGFWGGHLSIVSVGGWDATPDPHYTVVLINHETRDQLKIELIDLPFPGARSYRIRVNGQWALKVPLASKTMVTKQLRGWLVRH
jgi:hypothetical protein